MPDARQNRYPEVWTSVDEAISDEVYRWAFVVNEEMDSNPTRREAYLVNRREHYRRMHNLNARRSREIHRNMTRPYDPDVQK